MKPLLVGELNPYGADPRYALFPYPERSAGGRLCHKILQTHRADYLRRFDRVNLCTGSWSLKEARLRAYTLWQERQQPGNDGKLILLGTKVAAAFAHHLTGDFGRPFETVGAQVLVLPHPSGLCRLWNEPGAYERARDAVAAFIGTTEKPLTGNGE